MSKIQDTKVTRQQARRAEIIHRKKLFDGEGTAEEIHAKYGFPPGAKCMGCGKHPGVGGITLRSFMSVADLKQRDPNGFGLVCEMYPDKVAQMLVPMKGPDGRPVPYVRISTVYACRLCAPAAERAAAHGPSYAIVDISRGPGPDKITSGLTAWDQVQNELVSNAVANMAKGDA